MLQIGSVKPSSIKKSKMQIIYKESTSHNCLSIVTFSYCYFLLEIKCVSSIYILFWLDVNYNWLQEHFQTLVITFRLNQITIFENLSIISREHWAKNLLPFLATLSNLRKIPAHTRQKPLLCLAKINATIVVSCKQFVAWVRGCIPVHGCSFSSSYHFHLRDARAKKELSRDLLRRALVFASQLSPCFV